MAFRHWIAGSALLGVAPPALASGGEVLSLVWLELALFALVVGSLFVLRLSTVRKASVLIAYAAAALTGLYITREWPYRDNLLVINTICIGLPFVAWLLAIVYLRRKQVAHSLGSTK